MTLVVLVGTIASGCGDDVQGDLRLFLTTPQRGLTPLEDPLAFVDKLQASLIDDALHVTTLGSNSRPNSGRKLDFGLLDGGKHGTLMILGLNDYMRKVSHGFGPPITVKSGMRQTISIPFSQYNTAVATKVPLRPDTGLAQRFGGTPATIYLDGGDLESGRGGEVEDLSALVTLLWSEDVLGGTAGELMVQVKIRDDQSVVSGEADPSRGDAVRFYLDEVDYGVRQIVTVGRNLVYESTVTINQPEVSETGYGTWEVRFALPLTVATKSSHINFDLTVFDYDNEEEPERASWQFDGTQIQEELLPVEFGRLVLGVAVLNIQSESERLTNFSSLNGEVQLSGRWDDGSLNLEVFVPDAQVQTAGGGDDLAGTDRVMILFDQTNGIPDPEFHNRFVGITVNAGDQNIPGCGPDPELLSSSGFSFTGEARGAPENGGFRVLLSVPWSDLAFDPAQAKYLGLEVRVLDELDVVTGTLSGTPGLKPEVWPVLRLYSRE